LSKVRVRSNFFEHQKNRRKGEDNRRKGELWEEKKRFWRDWIYLQCSYFGIFAYKQFCRQRLRKQPCSQWL